MRSFAGKTVLITGASSGLGAEMARQLVAAGARVGLLARREAELTALTQELMRAAGRDGMHGTPVAAYAACDVTNRDATVAALRGLEAQLGPCDVLIANAGIGLPVKATRFDAERAAQVVRVNLFGALNAFEAVLSGMIARRQGQIVGISSIASFTSFPESHPYSASKAALSNELEGLRMELCRYGVDVTTICPGFIRTDLTASNRFPMPFLMDCKPAVERMLGAIAAKKRVYIFPLRLYLLVRIQRLIPAQLLARLASGKIDMAKVKRSSGGGRST